MDMVEERHIGSQMLVVLRGYGITFSASVENLFSIHATDQDLRVALNQIYECWVEGGLSISDLKLSFEVVRGFVLKKNLVKRMKVVDAFLANLPRKRDARSFTSHLLPSINQLRDEVSSKRSPRLF